MRHYFLRRFLYMVVLLFAVSLFSFILVQLPPGDYLTSHIARLEETRGTQVDAAEILALQREYGLDQPLVLQYVKWVTGMLRGDFGRSFAWRVPVAELIRQRLGVTLLISILTMILTYAVAVPIGIFSATHQYSIADYLATTVGFIGLAMPNFFLALVLMYYLNRYLGVSVGGLYSPEFLDKPWSWAKFADLLMHLPIPIVVIGLSGSASLIRIMRSSLLDELQKQYVIAGRSKGLSELRLLFRYPVRLALNPIVSAVGWVLPGVVSGATVTAITMALPTIGALLYEALLAQDTYVAGGCILILSAMTVIGMFISDILLVVVDPRIRFS